MYEPKIYIFDSMQLSYNISSKFFVRIIVITFAVSLILSFNLWGNNRTFPLFPIFDIQINWIHKIAQYGFLILIFICILIPGKKLIKSFLIFLVFLISLDQIRLQPWVYFTILCLIPFAFKNKQITRFNYLRILFIVVYIWSGIHKLNEKFYYLYF